MMFGTIIGTKMKTILSGLMALMLLSGCATFGGNLSNRVTCTAAKDEAYVVSKYGSVGIASQIDDRDRAVICK